MSGKRGFTLTELMVVVLIVGILAAAAIPILRGRIDGAKWSEGKGMMGSIVTAIRTYRVEKGPTGKEPQYLGVGDRGLGFADGDLTGAYFSDADFSFKVKSMDPLEFTVKCDAGNGSDPPEEPKKYELNQAGVFTPK